MGQQRNAIDDSLRRAYADYLKLGIRSSTMARKKSFPVLDIAALKAEREASAQRTSKLDVLIAAYEDFVGAAAEPALPVRRKRQPRRSTKKSGEASASPTSGAFVGLGLPEASVKQLVMLSPNREPRHSREIWAALSAAGFKLASKNPERAVACALRKREKNPGDVMLIGDGLWVHDTWLTPAKKDEYLKTRGYHASRDRKTHSEKTRIGMKLAATTRGVRFGKAPKMTPEIMEKIEQMIRGQRKVAHISRELGISKASIYGYFTVGHDANGRQTVERRKDGVPAFNPQPDLLSPRNDTSVH